MSKPVTPNAGKAPRLTLTQVAANGPALAALVASTIRSYKAVGNSLHQTACALFWHVAEYGETHALNEFYKGLRVNDQTALRVWFGKHATFVDLASSSVKPWIKFSTKELFTVVKGTQDNRKGLFLVERNPDEQAAIVNGDDNKTILINLKPFFDKDVKEKDALTLEELIKMLAKAADSVTKKSTDEGIALPADILTLTTSIKNTTAKELANIERIKE